MDVNIPGSVEPPQLLIDLAEGRLAPDEVETVELLLRAEGLTSPPPWVLRRAERLVRQRRPIRRGRTFSWPETRLRILAALAFDSQVQPQFVGLRATQTHVRRLLFQAENIEVDLEMAPLPSSSQVRLMGQITAGGTSPSGGYLRLSTSDWECMATLDENGEFWLEGLEPGSYRLEVAFGGRVIEVQALPL